jgi:hypothetical protein
MNTRALIFLPLVSLLLPMLSAQSTPPAPEPPVPVSTPPALPEPNPAPAPAAAAPTAVENQRVYGATRGSLVEPETARVLGTKFRAVYGQDSSPRIVVYVNRALVDNETGLRLIGRTEKFETTSTSSKSDMETPASTGTPATQVNVSVGGQAGPSAAPVGKGTASQETRKTAGENTYAQKDGAKLALADQQTVRDVERLVGRVFRNAGARLADQTAAAALLDHPAEGGSAGLSSGQQREALKQIADIAIEILISSRTLTVPGISGDATYAVPDIHATAIRLKDSVIVGQASASDVLGRDASAGRIVKLFDVRDITEATAFALMEDMLTGH